MMLDCMINVHVFHSFVCYNFCFLFVYNLYLDSCFMNSSRPELCELTKAQKQRAEIAREYFANRREQTKYQKQRINDRYATYKLCLSLDIKS